MGCDVHVLRHGELQAVLFIHEHVLVLMLLFVKHPSVELGRLQVGHSL